MIVAKRVVFDCNTLLQALASPDGPAGRCVQLVFDEKISLFISPRVLEELQDVARRPAVVSRLGLKPQRVQSYCQTLELAATILTDVPELFTYPRDPDDALYVNLALAAGAELIVSRDKDLLDLMDVVKPEAAEFQKRFPMLRILDPVAFLREVGARV
jgi:putative PIN family toxin of toxin-antitoxin system